MVEKLQGLDQGKNGRAFVDSNSESKGRRICYLQVTWSASQYEMQCKNLSEPVGGAADHVYDEARAPSKLQGNQGIAN
jgi:hypothetical protein